MTRVYRVLQNIYNICNLFRTRNRNLFKICIDNIDYFPSSSQRMSPTYAGNVSCRVDNGWYHLKRKYRASSVTIVLYLPRAFYYDLAHAVHESSEPISRRVFVTYARSRSQNTNKLAYPWIIHGPCIHTQRFETSGFFSPSYSFVQRNGRRRVASHRIAQDQTRYRRAKYKRMSDRHPHLA